MATKTDTEAKAAEGAAGGGKKKLIIIAVPVLLVVLGAVWFLFLRGGGEEAAATGTAAEAAAEPTHEPGVVLVTEPITINLAGGHYLKVGMALQQDAALAGGHGEPDGSKALDIAIGLFSGMSIDELSTPEGRAAAKAELVEEVKHAYHDEFYDVYFTEFVFQ